MPSFSPYVACHTEHWLCRVLKVQVFLAQLRERRNALTELDIEQSKVDRKLKAHQKRLTKTSKSIQMLYSSMMVWMHRNLHSSITQGTCSQVGAFECLPLGILQIIYSLRVARLNPEKIDLMSMLGLRAINEENFHYLNLQLFQIAQLECKYGHNLNKFLNMIYQYIFLIN
jgi:hypothetical protein